MKRIVSPLFFLLAGCSSAMMGSARNDKHQAEMAIHKARTDLEDVKYELNSAQSQLQILENKLSNQDAQLAALKQEVIASQKAKIDVLADSVKSVEKQCHQTHKHQKKTLEYFKDLSDHAVDTKTALSQYKNKIVEVEHQLASQAEKIQEIIKIKQKVEELSQLALQLPISTQEEKNESKEADLTDRR